MWNPSNGIVPEHRFVGIKAHPCVDRLSRQKGADDLFALVGDRDKLDRLIFQFIGKVVKVWNRGNTWAAPRRPEFEHHNFSLKGRPTRFCSFGGLQQFLEPDRGWTFPDFGFAGLAPGVGDDHKSRNESKKATHRFHIRDLQINL